MSEYSDRVRDSVAVSNLRQADDKLRELSGREWEHQIKIDLMDRLRVVITHVLGRLTVPDCSLVTESMLRELGAQSQILLNEIQQIESLPLSDESNNTQIDSTIDDLLQTAAHLPALPFRTTPAVVQKAAEQFSREATSATNRMSEKFTKVESHLADKSKEVQSQLSGVLAKLEEVSQESERIRGQTQEAMNSHLVQFQSDADTLRGQVGSGIDQLNAAVSDMGLSFTRRQDENEVAFSAAQEDRHGEYNKWRELTSTEIEDLRDQAKRMLEEVAGSSTAEHYANHRDKQNAAADRWRRVGVGALVLLVVVTSGIFVHSTFYGSDISVSALLLRSSVPVSLLVLATYALRQSGHHRQREEDESRVSNELMLLWPFMNRLPQEDREALLREITPLYFKGGLSHHDAGDKVGLVDRVVERFTPRSRG